jgi:hypothetical protein
MNDALRPTLLRAALVMCFLGAAPLSASAQTCEAGTISEITFDRQKPFSAEETSEDAALGGVFRAMNSVHVTTKRSTLRWELLFKEGDCFDPILLQELERNLRGLPYIMEASVESEELPDGTHRVNVMTQDVWALSLSIAFSFDGGFEINGMSAAAKNLFGTGTSVEYFSSTFRDWKRTGGMLRQPNVIGTRVDATVHGGNTRSGWYCSESLFRPFTGEVGRNAFRQQAHRRDDYFSYSVDPSLGFTQALLRFEAEQYEATYQRRFGDEAGPRFVAGIGVSREVVRFPFGAQGGQIVTDSDFDSLTQAPPEVLAEISSQARDHATNRANFTIGVRSMRFGTKSELDALHFLQDIQLGSDLTLTVAPGFPSGDDNTSDVLTRVQGNIGISAGKLYLLLDGDFEARNVASDDDGGPTGWRDVLMELDGTGYYSFTETSTLFGRVMYTTGSRMDRPFQLTLGGREAVRGFNDDAFPGASRFLATLEQRIPMPGVTTSIADLGLAGFVDAGKIWGGDVPYGADSDWQASIGVGVRIRAAAGGQSVVRMDFGVPLTSQENKVVFRFYTEMFGLLDRRTWPTQTNRSRWYGVDPDLATRPVNPLAGH